MSKRKNLEKDPAGSSKSQKIDQNSEEIEVYQTPLDELSRFESMPREVIEKIIFLELSLKDILNLTLTSKTLNAIISSSSMIMRRLRLSVSKVLQSSPADWRGTRNYCNLFMDLDRLHFLESTILTPFAAIACNLTKIEIKTYNRTFVSKLLKLCTNVETLIMKPDDGVSFRGDFLNACELLKTPGRFNRLKSLHLPKVETSLIGFEDANIKHLEIGFVMYDAPLKRFLLKRQTLESLTLKIYGDFFRFDDDFVNNISFKLRKLVLSLRVEGMEENVAKFIKLHKDTLEFLSFSTTSSYQSNFLDILGDFPKLQMIETRSYLLNAFGLLPQVKVLKLDGSPDAQSINEKFPNIKEIHSRCFAGFNIMQQNMLIHLDKFVQCLQSPGYASLFVIPSVRIVKFLKCNFTSYHLMNSNAQIEELIIESCVGCEWLTTFIKKENTHVRLLTLYDMELPQSCRDAIEQNPHKIDNVIMAGVTFK